MRLLRGITHAHSRYSFDGKLELGQLHDLLSQRGYDFVFMSEHIEELTPDSMARFVSECATLSVKGCVMVPGIEIDALHILIYGIARRLQPGVRWRNWLSSLSSRAR